MSLRDRCDASLVATADAKAPRQPAEERVLTATVPYRRQANRVSGTQSPQRRPTKTNTTKNATAKKFDRPKLDVKPSDPGLSQPNAENLRTMVWVWWATPPPFSRRWHWRRRGPPSSRRSPTQHPVVLQKTGQQERRAGVRRVRSSGQFITPPSAPPMTKATG